MREKKIRGTPLPPKKADFGWTKAELGCFTWVGQKLEDSNKS